MASGPLGTLDRNPPPFFRPGLSARSKLVFFAALAVFLMVADGRYRIAVTLRDAVALVLAPVQRTLAVPVELATGGREYLQGLAAAQQQARQAQQELARLSEKAASAERLLAENQQLRALLELKPALAVRAMAAEVLYEAADPYSRKVFVGAGLAQGVKLGSPVINQHGVLGQVTRIFALSSEVTLLADKDAAIPVLNTRTQQRSAAFGGVQGQGAFVMELRFMSGNADVQVGDLLQTSGVDGVYPAGLPVARVASVDRKVDSSFARVLLVPEARPDGVRHVLLLEPLGVQMPPRPEPEPEPVVRPGRAPKGPGR
ncbi:MAG: rod shape-determining protein MreC [Rubrivivax sp.]|nr:rod shape-determining protein MreC [Rubrivivax sp.]